MALMAKMVAAIYETGHKNYTFGRAGETLCEPFATFYRHCCPAKKTVGSSNGIVTAHIAAERDRLIVFAMWRPYAHSAFVNTRRDRSDCSDNRRRLQLNSVRVAICWCI